MIMILHKISMSKNEKYLTSVIKVEYPHNPIKSWLEYCKCGNIKSMDMMHMQFCAGITLITVF